MSFNEITVSVIIPTHNRVHSTKRLLDKLAMQSYPLHLMEVIVVANSCTDATIQMLETYKASFSLRYAETQGTGPAVPRNKGASLATGSILVFLDDDVDPLQGLVKAHVDTHENRNTVVIGYLPLAVPPRPGFFKLKLRSWWEEKFQRMQNKGYRYSYEDVLSGNFSISSELFKNVQGFITELRCRDDYELGIRLIKSGADLRFSKDAWAYHCDEVTDLDRSLKRKREEGRTDVRLWRIHPDISTPLQEKFQKSKYDFSASKTAYLLINWPALSDAAAKVLRYTMNILERFRLRNKWGQLNDRLHAYWYYKGLLDELNTRENLHDYLNYVHPKKLSVDEAVIIDLKKGIQAAEKFLDQTRPASLQIQFGNQLVACVPPKPGAEKLKGIHLRRLLATEFYKPFLKALALDELTHTKMERE